MKTILVNSCALALATAALLVAAPCYPAAGERPKVDLSEVRERANSMPSDLRRDTDKRIATTVARVNQEARDRGQATMAARLAAEFKLTEESVLDEKAEYSLNWGEYTIAHTLLAQSPAGLALVDLVQLRKEGLTWGAIAFGLQFHMEDFEDMLKAEGKVAMGLPKK